MAIGIAMIMIGIVSVVGVVSVHMVGIRMPRRCSHRYRRRRLVDALASREVTRQCGDGTDPDMLL